MGFPTNGGRGDGRHNDRLRQERAPMANRRYDREFKIAAVRLVQEQGYSPAEAAKRLGVDRKSVSDWVEKFAAELGLAPTGEGAVAAELRRLRAENARLRAERDLLKKAAAYFANPPS